MDSLSKSCNETIRSNHYSTLLIHLRAIMKYEIMLYALYMMKTLA